MNRPPPAAPFGDEPRMKSRFPRRGVLRARGPPFRTGVNGAYPFGNKLLGVGRPGSRTPAPGLFRSDGRRGPPSGIGEK